MSGEKGAARKHSGLRLFNNCSDDGMEGDTNTVLGGAKTWLRPQLIQKIETQVLALDNIQHILTALEHPEFWFGISLIQRESGRVRYIDLCSG